jgi:hypothetical protein
MDAKKWVILPSINFPSTTLMINSIVEELTTGYFRLKFDQYSLTLEL